MRPQALTLDPVDVARAQRGDKEAKNRVSAQKCRIRKRQNEIDAWDALNVNVTDVVVSSFDNDNACDNDDNTCDNDDNACDNNDDTRYV